MSKRRLLGFIIILFIGANVIAFQHAYKFTHFSTDASERTKDPKDLSAFKKVGLLFTGIDNPRPRNKELPAQPYQILKIQSTTTLECWQIDTPNAIGTVVMFHGYAGYKSSLLERANEFRKLGYNVFLVDFMGSGGSEGGGTSIGYIEAEQVRDCFNYIQDTGENNIVLFGTSMGAAAILKAMNDYSLAASSLILECPFGSLYRTVSARFKLMGVPSFPMAGLLCFWGGIQNGYWAFTHNPSTYATSVLCPTLLLFGVKDDRVGEEETDLIFANLKGVKMLKKYPEEGHNVFTPENRFRWSEDVSEFLTNSYSR